MVKYTRHPVDDLQSFMWTASWGTVFNRLALEGAGDVQINRVQYWRRTLPHVPSGGRIMAFEELINPVTPLEDNAPLVKKMSPLFRRWKYGLEDLHAQFLSMWRVSGLQPVQRLHIFYWCALEGVADYAELLIELRSKLAD